MVCPWLSTTFGDWVFVVEGAFGKFSRTVVGLPSGSVLFEVKYSGVGVRGVGSGRVHYALAERSLRGRRVHVDRLTCNARGTGGLFHSVVRRTRVRFNFRTSGVPLVVRTVPIDARDVVLVVAGMRSPRRLSAHFSGFTPFEKGSGASALRLSNTSGVVSVFRGLCRTGVGDARAGSNGSTRGAKTGRGSSARIPSMGLVHLCRFSALSSIVTTTRKLGNCFANAGALCGSPTSRLCGLMLRRSSLSPRSFGEMYGVLARCKRKGTFSLSKRTCLARRKRLVSSSTLRRLVRLWWFSWLGRRSIFV